ncbi:MAG: BrnT family toxin [Thiothrix sp.]
MHVEWDKAKAKINEAKHGVRFTDVESVLYDPMGVTIEDITADGEQRLITFGADMFGRVLAVVYTWRDKETIRLISARKATNREKQQYESGI